MRRSPVVLVIAVLCVLATAAARWLDVAAWPLTSWLVHIDAQHLGVTLVTWLVLGVWLEPRVGSARMALWIAAAVGVSTFVHRVIHPQHAGLLGLSAVAFGVFSAGLTAAAADRMWGRLGLLGIAVVLVHEWHRGSSPGQEFVEAVWGSSGRFAGVGRGGMLVPVPLVHMACAGAGVGFGLLARKRLGRGGAGGRQRPSVQTGRRVAIAS